MSLPGQIPGRSILAKLFAGLRGRKHGRKLSGLSDVTARTWLDGQLGGPAPVGVALDPVWIPSRMERRAQLFGGLLEASGAQGNLIYDAHLAALAIEHGLVLCNADADFARFPRLRWHNPLTGRKSSG